MESRVDRQPMQLGFVSAILPELQLPDLLAFAREEDFDCVEIMCWPVGRAERKYAGVTHLDAAGLTAMQADDINALAREHGVRISGLGYYPNPLDPHPAVARVAVDHLKKVIRAAARLGRARPRPADQLPQVNSFIGRDWTKSLEDNWPRFLKTWRPLIALAEDEGVRVGIENCPMLFTRDEWPGGKNLAMCPAIWRRMFEAIPSRHFGLNYDPSHAILLRFDHLAPLREFSDRLFHVHAKDIRFDRRACNDWGILGLPNSYHHPRIPGFGEIDWGEFMGTLMQTGYRGPVCIEVEDETFGKTLADRQRALKTARNTLRPYLCS